ncbi:germination protein M [Lachnospiraceae bacterium]|nr:germination protein M [Lachnospiraceae bacterium]
MQNIKIETKRIRNTLILFIFLCVFIIGGLVVSGTRKGDSEKRGPSDGFSVYYLDQDGMEIQSETRKSLSENATVGELLTELMKDPSDARLKRTMGADTTLLNYQMDRSQLILNFDTDYMLMPKTTEVLFRAAVVHTMCQLDSVTGVRFFVAGDPLLNSTGDAVGVMTDRTFIDNAGDEINSYNKGNIHLYFADTTGTLLVRTNEEVVYSTNVSMEKLVMEKLIAGPTDKSAYPTMSPDTKINSINVKDGICYVSLDSSVADKPVDVTEEVVLYSIVNSLTELPGIHEVQVSVNGKNEGTLRGEFPLDKLYSRNTDLVKRKENKL